MIFVRLIDEQGFFLGDCPHYEGELTEFTIQEPCPGGFHLPRWDFDGEQWVESKTQEEIDNDKAAAVSAEPTLEERVDGVETEVVGLQEEIDILFGGA